MTRSARARPDPLDQSFASFLTANGIDLDLAKAGARRHGRNLAYKKLCPEQPFYAGQPLGSLTANAQPELATILPEGRASISPSRSAKAFNSKPC